MSDSRISTNGQAKPKSDRLAPAADASLDDRKTRIRDAMNSRRDRITELWQEAETRLKAIGFHSDVLVATNSYGPEGDPDPDHATMHDCLSFIKVGSAWRICVVGNDDMRGDEYRFITPITDCSVEMRVRMIRYFGKLERQIIEDGERAVPKLDSAIAAFETELGLSR